MQIYEELQARGLIAQTTNEEEIRKLKHALNVFNASNKVPGFEMTVDEMLVYLPQLSREKNKLLYEDQNIT